MTPPTAAEPDTPTAPPPTARPATEADLLAWVRAGRRRVELANGILSSKPMGAREGYWAFALQGFFWAYQRAHDVGVFGAPDASMRLAPGLVRVPDFHFTAWARLPDDRAHLRPVADYPPDLAVEILSPSNRPGAVAAKVGEYFAAGTRQVWVIDPDARTVAVYTAPRVFTTLTAADTLTCEPLLPGFAVPLADLFGHPQLNPRPANYPGA